MSSDDRGDHSFYVDKIACGLLSPFSSSPWKLMGLVFGGKVRESGDIMEAILDVES